jgi:uncharacterized metal-binding protein
MPELPQKKVGIVACSGEEMAEGTISRLATLRVLEQLCPGETVTICLPLFLAGGEGDRAFARFYPTIAVDGCEMRCAYRATEKYSNRPAAGIVVRDVIAECALGSPKGKWRLDGVGGKAVEETAKRIARLVAGLMGEGWNRRSGQMDHPQTALKQEEKQTTCACGSGIPIQHLMVNGEDVTVIALPVILANFKEQGKPADETTAREILETVKVYNSFPAGSDAALIKSLFQAYCAVKTDRI